MNYFNTRRLERANIGFAQALDFNVLVGNQGEPIEGNALGRPSEANRVLEALAKRLA